MTPFSDVAVMDDVFRAIGIIGFFAYLFGFAALQFNRIRGQSVAYALINIFAASCVLVSLIADFNMSSLLIQCSWITIGTAGIIKRARLQRQSLPLAGENA